MGGVSVALGGAALAMMPYLPPTKIALTTLGVALPCVIYVISNAVIGEITPPSQRGALLAIGTAGPVHRRRVVGCSRIGNGADIDPDGVHPCRSVVPRRAALPRGRVRELRKLCKRLGPVNLI